MLSCLLCSNIGCALLPFCYHILSSALTCLANCRFRGVNCRGYAEAHSPVHGRQGAYHISCQEPSPGEPTSLLHHPFTPAGHAVCKCKAFDSSICPSDEQMYRAARLGAARRGERWNEPSLLASFPTAPPSLSAPQGISFSFVNCFTCQRCGCSFAYQHCLFEYSGAKHTSTTVNWTFQLI